MNNITADSSPDEKGRNPNPPVPSVNSWLSMLDLFLGLGTLFILVLTTAGDGIISIPFSETTLLLSLLIVGLLTEWGTRAFLSWRGYGESPQGHIISPRALDRRSAVVALGGMLGALSAWAVFSKIESLMPASLAGGLAILCGFVMVGLTELVWRQADTEVLEKLRASTVTTKLRGGRPLMTQSALLLLLAITLLIAFLTPWRPAFIRSGRALLGSIFLLLAPGYLLSLVFFPSNALDIWERLIFSFVLSVASVPLVLSLLNALGVPISLGTVILAILMVTSGSAVVLIFRNKAPWKIRRKPEVRGRKR